MKYKCHLPDWWGAAWHSHGSIYIHTGQIQTFCHLWCGDEQMTLRKRRAGNRCRIMERCHVMHHLMFFTNYWSSLLVMISDNTFFHLNYKVHFPNFDALKHWQHWTLHLQRGVSYAQVQSFTVLLKCVQEWCNGKTM